MSPKNCILLCFTLLVLLTSPCNSFDLGEIIKDGVNSFAQGINTLVDASCVAKNVLAQRCPPPKLSGVTDREACCHYFDYIDCVYGAIKQDCGRDPAQKFLDAIKSSDPTYRQCDNYVGLFGCLNPLFIGIGAIGVLVLMICCCVGCCRSRRNTPRNRNFV